jgi:hypothetical protein
VSFALHSPPPSTCTPRWTWAWTLLIQSPPFIVYNLTPAPERANRWYRDAHPTTSCDRFHLCPSEGYGAGGGRGLHTNWALPYLILYGSMPCRLLIPIMKIKDPFARLRIFLHHDFVGGNGGPRKHNIAGNSMQLSRAGWVWANIYTKNVIN